MGHDITVANFYNSVPILDPNSCKAGYMLWDTISRLQAVKKGNCSDTKEGDTTKCVDKLSFRNLAPWLENKKATISERFSQTSMYLHLASSIIAVTFSRQVVPVLFTNFVHQDGLSSRINLVDIVGVPQIVLLRKHILVITYLSNILTSHGANQILLK
ncbi:uncharacterized protein EV154DRAFT_495753 [Mucor mucedo]|uniref:uncharacterized protein n=1 Tax=Mucor mucedo TaxID=29922 RepID=UPI00221EF572|nr:uncharacterized protein EV154DRAFT_495753 [Mucor mucedo]KAI7895363.1 hypothetical protein EV154DRAFT_495753 [Mucor mucedo]